MAEGAHRPAWLEIDLAAIEHNAAVLAELVAPSRLCAVVKADAYGHGAVEAARAALKGGATELAVAIVDEGVELREAGIDCPILVLSEPGPDGMAEVFGYRLTPTLYTPEGIALAALAATSAAATSTSAAASSAASAHGGASRPPVPPPSSQRQPAPVEIKVDTGMHRVGAAARDLVDLVRALGQFPQLDFAGLWTHLAVADEPENDFTAVQLTRFAAARELLASAGLPEPGRVHAANSAGALVWPESRLDMVRCGMALYGYAPSPALAASAAASAWPQLLRPALAWVTRVAFVRELEAGERVSYGLRAPLPARALVATIPLGYADGIPRQYFIGGGEVLVNGHRRRLAGSVTMDQILVDCDDDFSVQPGDEVVLIGEQQGERITADDWAAALGTICYEVVTRIGPRVPRVYVS